MFASLGKECFQTRKALAFRVLSRWTVTPGVVCGRAIIPSASSSPLGNSFPEEESRDGFLNVAMRARARPILLTVRWDEGWRQLKNRGKTRNFPKCFWVIRSREVGQFHAERRFAIFVPPLVAINGQRARSWLMCRASAQLLCLVRFRFLLGEDASSRLAEWLILAPLCEGHGIGF